MSVIVLMNNTNYTCLILIYAQIQLSSALYLQNQDYRSHHYRKKYNHDLQHHLCQCCCCKSQLNKSQNYSIINNFNQQRGQIDHQHSMNQIYPQYQQASQSIDSLSIIQNLNTSIEDLLHKINQIHQQYSSSSLNISLQPPQQHISPYLSGNKNKNRQSYQRKHVYQSDSYPTRTIRSKTSKNTANLIIQVQRSVKDVEVSIVQRNKQRFLWNESLQYKGFLMHNVQNPENDCNFKRIVQKKITSLFNNDAVRQVKQSVRIGSKASNIIQSDGLQRDINKLEDKNLTLSDFMIGQKVGSGKFGQVYFCMHKQTKTVYALKKIFKSTIKQYNLEEQLCLELKILYFLNHPNVVKLYSHFTDDYHIFLLMEYVEGGELMLRLKRDESYTSIIIEQVTNAIGYLHKHNIIHRDIKPQNIVVSFQTTAKICDFGWAAVCDKKTMRKTFCGTLDYISPQMKEFGQYNRKIDLWSLGILTYQMLVGQVPFKDNSVQLKKKKILKKQWDWDIQYSASISGIAQSFMRNLLRKNPNQRANITFCKNHYFIRKYKQLQHGNIIQIPFIL